MKKPVLVIMAAGMGSRYGGLKQIDPVDPEGHIIMDFSLYDAKKAGFEEVIFIIKIENEKVFNLLREHWFISIKGNHEQFCQEGFLNDHVAYSHKAPNNGGSWFYKLNEDIQEHIVNRFKSLPVLLEVHYQNKKFGFGIKNLRKTR